MPNSKYTKEKLMYMLRRYCNKNVNVITVHKGCKHIDSFTFYKPHTDMYKAGHRFRRKRDTKKFWRNYESTTN